MGKAEQGSCSLPRGVTLRQHKTGSMLVITFAFKGVLCREPLSKVDISPPRHEVCRTFAGGNSESNRRCHI